MSGFLKHVGYGAENKLKGYKIVGTLCCWIGYVEWWIMTVTPESGVPFAKFPGTHILSEAFCHGA